MAKADMVGEEKRERRELEVCFQTFQQPAARLHEGFKRLPRLSGVHWLLTLQPAQFERRSPSRVSARSSSLSHEEGLQPCDLPGYDGSAGGLKTRTGGLSGAVASP